MQNVIDILREATPSERAEKINAQYEKNRRFFKDNYPVLHKFLEQSACPFHIDITDGFLNIVKTANGALAHPEAGLDRFAEMLGDWTHDAWIDFCNFVISIPEETTEHYRLFKQFDKTIKKDFRDFPQRFSSRTINLKVCNENRQDKRFSPPVAFIGIFHGLHIDYYLSRTEVTDILMVEPEPERFMVSCYFLDYESLFKKVHVNMVIGADIPDDNLNTFLSWTKITPFLWLRILPGYACPFLDRVISAIRLWQVQHFAVSRPIDMDLDGMKDSVRNIKAHELILSKVPVISTDCRIAVIGSGPSLEENIPWLKANHEKLILFASHTSIKVLRRHGIVPDFQVSLDTKFDQDFLASLQFYKNVPLITLSKAHRTLVDYFKTVLLVEDPSKAHAVKFFTYLKYSAPSTGNMALAIAMLCSPSVVYLLGLDFGYRDRKIRHTTGSIHVPESITEKSDKTSEEESSEKDLLRVKANFPETGTVLTEPFYNIARFEAEKCIADHGNGTAVYNLSDGAAISGTVSMHFHELSSWEYGNKEADIAALQACFSRAERGRNWEPFPTRGKEIIDTMRSTVLETLTMEGFDWRKFSMAIDDVIPALKKYGDTGSDAGRQEVFYRLLIDILLDYYRFLIYCDSHAEAERIYRAGLYALSEFFDSIKWPEELDL